MNRRKTIFQFVALSFVLLLVVSTFNIVLDPFGSWNITPRWDIYRAKSGLAIGKYHMLEKTKCDWVLLGGSRTEAGYDPASAQFPSPNVCNLGIAGAIFSEVHSIGMNSLRMAHPRHVVLTLDYVQFAGLKGTYNQFSDSLFNPRMRSLEYYGSILLGFNSLYESISLIDDIRKDRRGPFTARGLKTSLWAGGSLQEQFHKRTRRSVRNLLVSNPKRLKEDLNLLLELAKEIKSQKVELIVLINPHHSILLEALERVGYWQELEKFKTGVVNVFETVFGGTVPIWDFNTANAYTNLEVRDAEEYFWEDSHFKTSLGEKVLQVVLSKRTIAADTEFAHRLTRANLPQTLAKQRAQYAKWKADPSHRSFSWFETALAEGIEDARSISQFQH